MASQTEDTTTTDVSEVVNDGGVEMHETAGGHAEYTLDDAIEQIGFGVFQIKLIFVAGLSWMADAMEMMCLSILAPILLCEWKLSTFSEAMITTVVFIGQGCGSLSWGFFSDNYGRKKSLYISVFLVLFFGVISSQAPNYTWMLILRFLVGFGIGGIPQASIILTEMLPTKRRGEAVIYLALFWAVGSLFAAAFAIPTVEQAGWRAYLLVITIPMLMFLIAAIWMPESPRFLHTTGKYDKLVALIKRMCAANKKPVPMGQVKAAEVNTKRGRLRDLFTKGWRRTAALLFMLWFTSAFSYYGIVLLTTEMFQTGIDGCNPVVEHTAGNLYANATNTVIAGSTNVTHFMNGTSLLPNATSLGECKRLTNEDYIDFMLTTIAEFPGIIIALLIIDRLGRRRSLALLWGLSALVFALLAFCTSRKASVAFLFVVRALITGSFQVVYLYTAEVLPTNIRAVGMGACSVFARVGAMTTPFVAQMLIHESFYWVVAVYFLPLMLCVFISLLLTIETAGKALSDSSKAVVFSNTAEGGYVTFA